MKIAGMIVIALLMILTPIISLIVLGRKLQLRLKETSPDSHLVRVMAPCEIFNALLISLCMTASFAILKLEPGGAAALAAVWGVFIIVYVASHLLRGAFLRKRRKREGRWNRPLPTRFGHSRLTDDERTRESMAYKAMTLLIATISLLAANVASAIDVPTVVEATDKAVLSVVVSLQCQGQDRGKVILSSKPTGPGDIHTWIPRSISSDRIKELVQRTEATTALPQGIECPRVRMITFERIKASFDKPAKHAIDFPIPAGVRIPIGANTSFEDTFPGVGILLRLSMPTYSEAKDKAIVYFSEDCGGLCAHGEYVVVERINGTWRVTQRLQAWTS
jgi:hypothetical protein